MPAAWPARLTTLSALWLALAGAGAQAPAPPASAPPASSTAPAGPPLSLRVVGGLAGVHQFTRHEEPFWRDELPRLSGGRLRADIVAFDRAGIRGQDMLRLMQLGVVPFGTVLLSMAGDSAPLLAGADLAGMNPDSAQLRRHAAAWRPVLEQTLREQHGVELLAVYVYPAQMLFCKRPLASLAELAGRRVRIASPTQADWALALGAKPVATPFAELAAAVRRGNVDCALTGSMTGYTLGLHHHASHLHTLPVNWGMAVFGAHAAAWAALPAAERTLLKQELMRLEQAIWAEAERETGEGVRCLTGRAGPQDCGGGAPGRMQAVAPTPADEQRHREVLARAVLPRWAQRCGAGCLGHWYQTLGPLPGTTTPGSPR